MLLPIPEASAMSYWVEASCRALLAAWNWPNSHGWEFAVITLVAAVIVRVMAMTILPRLRGVTYPFVERILAWAVVPGLSGVFVAFAVITIWHLANDPAQQIAAW